MKPEEPAGEISRRGFLKNFPRVLLNHIQPFAERGFFKERSNEGSGRYLVRLDLTRCLAWGGVSCQLCYLACPLRDSAVEMHDQKPVIVESCCDGCGMCVTACQTVNDLPALKVVYLEEKAS